MIAERKATSKAKLRQGYCSSARRSKPGATRDRLIERASEIEQIDQALAGATGGEGRLVVIEGPAGIGKTALLNAARERAVDAGLAVVAAVGSELESAYPYG